MTIFDIISNIIRDKDESMADDKDFDASFIPFHIVRWFSMRRDLIEYAEFINQNLHMMSKRAIFLYLVRTVPKSKSTYIKYIKPKDTKQTKV